MAGLGSRQDNEQNSYKIVTDDAEQQVAQRVDDPAVRSKLDEVILAIAGATNSETLQFTGTQNTTPALFPPVSAGLIIEIAIISKVTNVVGDLLQVSFDDGATYMDLGPGVSLTWSPGGITQIKLKSNGASVGYDILLNRLL